MRILLLCWLLPLVLGGCQGVGKVPSAQPTIPTPGSMAPDFTLRDHAGDHRSLSASFQSVNVYAVQDGQTVQKQPEPRPACLILGSHSCRFTLQEVEEMKKLLTEMGNPAVDTYAVLSGEEESIRQWTEAGALPFPVLVDKDKKVLHRYGVKMTPDIYMVNAQGVVVYRSGGGFLAQTDLKPLVERLAEGKPFEGVALPEPGEG